MIPATVASEIQRTLIDYLRTTFNLQDVALERALLDFLTQELFKGPYVDLRLPFRRWAEAAALPLTITPPFTPYVHQVAAFARLTSQDDHQPQPTLVTTGTGSGKTECFLYPILDHCYRQRQQPGIKAIILYPMNALATDQAGRLAEIIWQDARLKGQVTAGLYIGGAAEIPHKSMGPTWLIDDRETLHQHPPDILLTNYKMLDFLLLRPEDKPLWAKNEATTLRYLVLDELHTYDGAQGADVAGLIRRVKARLDTPPGTLCPIGTSATVGSAPLPAVTAAVDGQAAPDAANAATLPLLAFAAQIFGEPFDAQSIITETRRTRTEFLDAAPSRFELPTDLDALREEAGEANSVYLTRLATAWFGPQPSEGAAPASSEKVEPNPLWLGQQVKAHSFLRALLAATRSEIVAWPTLLARVARQDAEFATLAAAAQELVLQSFLALIAHSRTAAGPFAASRHEPLLTLQVQLWVREMSRLMRAIAATPAFFWRDDRPQNDAQGLHGQRGLPAYYCRECGHSGWLALRYQGDDYITDNSAQIYKHYFDRSHNVCYLYPGTRAGEMAATGQRLCPHCLKLSYGEMCPTCQQATLSVVVHQATSQSRGAQKPRQDLQQCPSCAADFALSIVGSQAASLASVAIGHLYTTPLNQDKKLLVFTDSVQDAAHRAAFFGARTYRFNLRTALQTALIAAEQGAQETNTNGIGIPLNTLPDQLLDYWHTVWQARADCDQHWVATFMPPDLADLSAYRAYMQQPTGTPVPPSLATDLRTRLAWEVVMEYGFAARVGRSLEKVGSSTAYVDQTQLAPVIAQLQLMLSEEIGLLRNLTALQVQHFVQGLLERTRVRGGVDHPLLKRYAEEQGNAFLLSKRQNPLLSPFHPHSPRLPRFLTEVSRRGVFDQALTTGGGPTWYVAWAQRALSSALGTVEINDIYRLVIQQLANAKLLHRYSQGKDHAYGLAQGALRVTAQVTQVHCTSCNQVQTVARHVLAQWQGAPCLRYQCTGQYTVLANSSDTEARHYYRAIYARGQVERIFSYEHTGLLARNVRETLEAAFKQRPHADAANLLTATPTLEMGIDIGDLSATMTSSVPPTTANYLQRIGRAGRKTGNSLILALAISRPHDLYFYAEPLELIAAAVEPPGVFLNAPNMLKRQFLAYCIDCWTRTEANLNALPRNVQTMLARYSRGDFPANFLRYYSVQKSVLIEQFLSLYQTVITPLTQTLLRDYAAGDALSRAITQAIEAVQAERETLRTARRDLQREVQKIEADPAEYEDAKLRIQELEQEMKLLLELLRTVDDQYILNFFTDAGLLPNYAFPEEGVKFRAIITDIPVNATETVEGTDRVANQRSTGRKYEVREYVRPAAIALRELAPFNTFYAEGRKLTVDRVEIPGRDKALERWQFCNRCGHMELIQTSHYHKTCPACNSAGWSDLGQQHSMVYLHQVGATTKHYESKLDDDADEREQERYQVGIAFALQQNFSTGAHLIPSLPFGFEHFTEATLREVNFGVNESHGARVQIAGEERPVNGFLVCRDCGIVAPPNLTDDTRQQPLHARNCASRLRQREVEWEPVYLYREVTSEALRMLLPVSTTLVEEKMATFAAAVQLGIQRQLGGDPSHLKIVLHTEVGADDLARRYLIIYDTVPGGTSYLRDLAMPETFAQVLAQARTALVSCTCRLDPNKQACYRCLYSYSDQRRLELLSRKLGIELLQEVLTHWNELQPSPSLGDVDLHSVLESELEQRFIDALGGYAAKTPKCQWLPTLINGKPSWLLTIGAQQWRIEPQVLLGSAQGVATASRADFVFWPQRITHAPARPIAIFTDGYEYHVHPGRASGEVGEDIQKRRTIIASGNFWVWSLSWDDVADFVADEPLKLIPFFTTEQEKLVSKLVSQLPTRLLTNNAMQQLLAYLAEPALAQWQNIATALAVATLLPPRPGVARSLLEAKAELLCTEPNLPNLSLPPQPLVGDTLYSIVERHNITLFVYLPQPAFQQKAFAQVQLLLRLDDTAERRVGPIFKSSWRWFLLLSNILQFVPRFQPLSSEYVARYANGVIASTPPNQPPTSTNDQLNVAWREALAYANPRCKPLLDACVAVGSAAPVPGYELVHTDGKVLAMAELGWATLQIAVFLDEQLAEDRQAFGAAGWQVFGLESIAAIVAACQVAC